MLVFRILTTVFISISIFTALLKNIAVINDKEAQVGATVFYCLWSVLWRAFVIVAVWVI